MFFLFRRAGWTDTRPYIPDVGATDDWGRSGRSRAGLRRQRPDQGPHRPSGPEVAEGAALLFTFSRKDRKVMEGRASVGMVTGLGWFGVGLMGGPSS